MPNKHKILLLDDHYMFAQGLTALIKVIEPDYEVIFSQTVDTAKKELLNNDYCFIIADILIPNTDMREFITYCRSTFPSLIIIMLSSIIEMDIIKDFFSLGANGYLSKRVDAIEIKQALKQTYEGSRYISSDLSGSLVSSFLNEKKTALTQQELKVLRLIAAGNTADQIGKILFISPYTVMAHRRNIMTKLDIHSSVALARYAFEKNL